MTYPLGPKGVEKSLEAYCDNRKKDEVFCYKDYLSGRYSYMILEYYLNKETNLLSVATTNLGEIKSLFLTSVTLGIYGFEYETRSFFSSDGLEKYTTLAKR